MSSSCRRFELEVLLLKKKRRKEEEKNPIAVAVQDI
jgi:hypothetical protein